MDKAPKQSQFVLKMAWRGCASSSSLDPAPTYRRLPIKYLFDWALANTDPWHPRRTVLDAFPSNMYAMGNHN